MAKRRARRNVSKAEQARYRAELARNRAVKTLTFYFRYVWEEAGLRFGPDNYAEVEGVVHDLIAASVETLKAERGK